MRSRMGAESLDMAVSVEGVGVAVVDVSDIVVGLSEFGLFFNQSGRARRFRGGGALHLGRLAHVRFHECEQVARDI